MIITLLSDLGTRDASVPVAKAILMQRVPDATIIDISHGVVQYDLQQAAYLLLSAYRSFAGGTVHILPVDIFGGTAPRMLMAKKDGHFFIAPDNGILPLAFGDKLENTRLCFECNKPYSFNEWMNHAGSVAETISHGWVLPYQPCTVKNAPKLRRHQVTPFGMECHLLYIDRYQNVVLDVTREQFDKIVQSKPFTIRIMKVPDITAINEHYNEVPAGAPLCRFNSAGFMEIAINHGHAANLLGLDLFSPGDLRYQVVRIFF